MGFVYVVLREEIIAGLQKDAHISIMLWMKKRIRIYSFSMGCIMRGECWTESSQPVGPHSLPQQTEVETNPACPAAGEG